MADSPITLDEHRGMAAQKATEGRRRLSSRVLANQEAVRTQQSELDRILAAAPASTWLEAAENARFLISLLSGSPASLDRRHQHLVARVLEDLDRLSRETRPSTPLQ